ncbi:MAG: vitamin K epoxide reductase family protein [Patescibacteria group bacterium]|jgi:uncharacterized membrane protein
MLNRKWLLIILLAASSVGIVAAGFSTAAHWNTGLYGFCELGEYFNCNVVNTSKYAEIMGVPVALFGLLSYTAFFIYGLISLKKPSLILSTFAGSLAIVGLGFSLYLSSVEAFILHTWCVVCITSQVAIILVAACVFWIRSIDSKNM